MNNNQELNQINSFGQNSFNPNSNKKKGLGFTILLIVFLILLIFLLLQVTDIFNVVDFVKNEINNDSNTELKKDDAIVDEDSDEKADSNYYEAELRKAAKNVDSEGNYNLEEFYSKSKIFENINYTDWSSKEKQKEIETLLKEVDTLFFCINGACLAYEYRDGLYIHQYLIETDKYEVTNYNNYLNQMNTMLAVGTYCVNLDENGDYISYNSKGEKGYAYCEDYICEAEYEGNIYQGDCREIITD